MARATKCQTPDTKFHTKITASSISISVDLPISLYLSNEDAQLLEDNLHNVVELVLARYFVVDEIKE